MSKQMVNYITIHTGTANTLSLIRDSSHFLYSYFEFT